MITVDRVTSWVDVRRAKAQTEESGARGLIAACIETFAAFGTPREMATDGGLEYDSHEFTSFLQRWGVRFRKSSAYYLSSNSWAEAAVKMVKRALRDNTGKDGKLDLDKFA